MAFPDQPVLTKFFANKIESSNTDWPDYLLEVANIFAEFDGEEFDRESLLDRFRTLSDRSPYSLRDPANFRDEFGAYGTYLGVYRIEQHDDHWTIVLSGAARQYLCASEPDVEAFCRAQLTLFQYPNGAGAAYSQTASNKMSVRVQANILKGTLREVQSGLKLVPFRLICRAILSKASALQLDPKNINLSYPEIFALANDSRTNTTPKPQFENIIEVLNEVRLKTCPSWIFNNHWLTKFKRNFHIFEHTGLITRTDDGLALNPDIGDKLEMVFEIANMNTFFPNLNRCASEAGQSQEELEQRIIEVIQSSEWGRYYDAANLPAKLLAFLTATESGLITPAESSAVKKTFADAFPPLVSYERTKASRKTPAPSKIINPEIIRLKKEKANRDHARLVERIAALSRLAGANPCENLFIDMFVEINGKVYIFEMKSCNPDNLLIQVRKGISQLYEYRYRSGHTDALLCLVLQCPPSEPWLIDYLVKDRGIQVCWLTDEVNLDCPEECREILEPYLP